MNELVLSVRDTECSCLCTILAKAGIPGISLQLQLVSRIPPIPISYNSHLSGLFFSLALAMRSVKFLPSL